MSLFSQVGERGHEQVVFFSYPHVGLKAIVAVHSTVLGPALGGCRMRLYSDEAKALDDALRLSEGMTYKSSIAGLDLGGGKACIIGDPHMQEGRRELFLQFGRCVDMLGGRYITAEDMGTSVQDVMTIREVTKYAAGFSQEHGGGGDPSPWTARGVFQAMRAACERKFASAELRGKRVALQGVGHVGLYLLKLLKEAGCEVTICDTVEATLKSALAQFPAQVVSPDAIYDVECDVYAPCAAGQVVNKDTIGRLKCKVIAGAANNQLADSSLYEALERKQILYCPDFVVNSGGVICVAGEYVAGGWKESWVSEKVAAIYQTTGRILDESKRRGKFPEVVALETAKERIRAAEQRKSNRS